MEAYDEKCAGCKHAYVLPSCMHEAATYWSEEDYRHVWAEQADARAKGGPCGPEARLYEEREDHE